MTKFRKKPIVIEAFRFGVDCWPDWFHDKVTSNDVITSGQYKDLESCKIKTLEGTMEARKGDWIIKGIRGELYPCKSDIFEKTYERFDDED